MCRTCHLASKLADHLQLKIQEDINKMKEKEQDYSRLQKAIMTPKDKLCIEIAALCHDLGVYNSFKLYHKDCTDAVKKNEKDNLRLQRN